VDLVPVAAAVRLTIPAGWEPVTGAHATVRPDVEVDGNALRVAVHTLLDTLLLRLSRQRYVRTVVVGIQELLRSAP